jgi:hypothetical protein
LPRKMPPLGTTYWAVWYAFTMITLYFPHACYILLLSHPLDIITIIIFHQRYKLWSSSLCSSLLPRPQTLVSSSFLSLKMIQDSQIKYWGHLHLKVIEKITET